MREENVDGCYTGGLTMTCDNQCEECGKYTTVKYNGG